MVVMSRSGPWGFGWDEWLQGRVFDYNVYLIEDQIKGNDSTDSQIRK